MAGDYPVRRGKATKRTLKKARPKKRTHPEQVILPPEFEERRESARRAFRRKRRAYRKARRQAGR